SRRFRAIASIVQFARADFRQHHPNPLRRRPLRRSQARTKTLRCPADHRVPAFCLLLLLRFLPQAARLVPANFFARSVLFAAASEFLLLRWTAPLDAHRHFARPYRTPNRARDLQASTLLLQCPVHRLCPQTVQADAHWPAPFDLRAAPRLPSWPFSWQPSRTPPCARSRKSSRPIPQQGQPLQFFAQLS